MCAQIVFVIVLKEEHGVLGRRNVKVWFLWYEIEKVDVSIVYINIVYRLCNILLQYLFIGEIVRYIDVIKSYM